MKKYSSILIIILVTGFFANAQSKSTKKADRLFAKFEFVEAAKAYQEVISKGNGSEYVYAQLAEAYYNVFNTVDAEKWYAKTLETSEALSLIFKYAQMLKANGKYEDSNQQMSKFATMRPADHRAIAFLENPNYLAKNSRKGKKFNVQELSINSEYSDFGVLLLTVNFILLVQEKKVEKKYGWNEEPFLDIYSSNKNNDGSYSSPAAVESLNTKYHEGVVSFSPDGKTMYFLEKVTLIKYLRETLYQEINSVY